MNLFSNGGGPLTQIIFFIHLCIFVESKQKSFEVKKEGQR